jgi:ATP-dependent DNA helicase PIF1
MSELLNSEQAAALRAVKNGRNIFLTGAGGTGKSHTIRAIVRWAANAGVRYAVTAMTGCAALLLGLGAKTVHSWAGVGLAREAPHELAEVVKRNKRAARRWTDTQLLIVDEISMMTPEFLEKLDHVARRVRKRHELRFGGIQLVFAGDFCQLPPVSRATDTDGPDEGPRFVFESTLWPALIDETHELIQIRRQLDPVFQKVLGEARMGRLTMESIKVLEERMGLPWQDNEIKPTLLFTRNAEVDTINRRNMEVLTSEAQSYEAETVLMDDTIKRIGYRPPTSTATTHSLSTNKLISPDDPDVQIALERLDTDAPYEKRLELRVGAQVMLITNLDQDKGLVNGSRGVITGYSPGGLPMVKFMGQPAAIIIDRANWWLPEYDGIGRSQIPLKVAYAITIHKSQGATLDSALVDIGPSTFEFGQAYVALSRVRSLFGLYVWKLDPRKVRCHPKVVAFYDALAAARTGGAGDEPSTVAAAGGAGAVAVATTTEEEPDPAPCDLWTTTDLGPTWTLIVEEFLASPKGARLKEQLHARAAISQIAPNPDDVFAALRICTDPAAIKVIILGQDPYPTAGNAHGLAFSVRPSILKLPPSLQNIYKELVSDLGLTEPPTTGCLTEWAKQGVLLLNDILTVTIGAPQSHSGLGWEELTSRILQTTLEASPHAVIVAWGRFAQKKLDATNIRPLLTRHTVLQAPHPSPLSAHSGFFGSRPFSQTNAALKAHGQTEIRWA